jgi:RimJ/RimL family protein N-acetyltransferase
VSACVPSPRSRLRGLAECPTAFASSHEEERDTPLDVVAGRLAAGADSAVVGAFAADGALVGVAGLYRERHRKLAHKATLWGMYVAPEARRGGVGRLLVERTLAHAFGPMGLRQVNLGVNAANAPALALYEATGFRAYGVERGFMLVDGVLQDEVQMVRVRDGS